MNFSKNRDHAALWRSFVQEGDDEALSFIFLDHYDLLFNYGLKYTKDHSTIEDSIQNVFIYLIKAGKRLGPVTNVKAYLYVSFRRELIHNLKKLRETELTDVIPETRFNLFCSPEEDIINKEESENISSVLKKCIGNLSPKQQEVIYLRFESGLTYENISEFLGITVESCYKTVYRSVRSIQIEAKEILKKLGCIFL